MRQGKGTDEGFKKEDGNPEAIQVLEWYADAEGAIWNVKGSS